MSISFEWLYWKSSQQHCGATSLFLILALPREFKPGNSRPLFKAWLQNHGCEFLQVMWLFSFFHLFCQELLVDGFFRAPLLKAGTRKLGTEAKHCYNQTMEKSPWMPGDRGLAQLLCMEKTDTPGLVIYINIGMAFGVETSVHSLQNCQLSQALWIRNFSYEVLAGAIYQMAVPGSLPQLHRDGHWSYEHHLLIQTAKEELGHR